MEKIKQKLHITRENQGFYFSAALFLVFLVFTLLVKVVDVKTIGPEGSKVGWAALNGALAAKIGLRMGWYYVAKVLGMLTFVVVAFYAFVGMKQLIGGRSFKAVDRNILFMGIFYVVVFGLYILFDHVAINYRPVILDAADGLEPSYPSSHTLLALCVMGTGVMLSEKYLPLEPEWIGITNLGMLAIAFLTVLGRLLSGVHWFTDILGSVILAASLLVLMFNLFELPDELSIGELLKSLKIRGSKSRRNRKRSFVESAPAEESLDEEDEDMKIFTEKFGDMKIRPELEQEEPKEEEMAEEPVDELEGAENVPAEEDLFADLPQLPVEEAAEDRIAEEIKTPEQAGSEQPNIGDSLFDLFGAKTVPEKVREVDLGSIFEERSMEQEKTETASTGDYSLKDLEAEFGAVVERPVRKYPDAAELMYSFSADEIADYEPAEEMQPLQAEPEAAEENLTDSEPQPEAEANPASIREKAVREFNPNAALRSLFPAKKKSPAKGRHEK